MSIVLSWDPRGRRVVVVGAGRVGTRRAEDLVEAGAQVEVIAPSRAPRLEELAADGVLQVFPTALHPEDLDDRLGGAALVVAATDDSALNEAIAGWALARNVLVNRADDGGGGDVTWTTSVRRGAVGVHVTTGGAAPGVARWVAELIDEGLDDLVGLEPDELSRLVTVVAEMRRSVRSSGSALAPFDWRSERAATILELIRSGQLVEAKERLEAWQSS
ncbi:MAG: bifunctional precorrin-2 dehydrogenase/sirohydrochlorin ferrochelatase [Actinomycetes bacterium]